MSKTVKHYCIPAKIPLVKVMIVLTDLEWERTHFQHTFTNYSIYDQVYMYATEVAQNSKLVLYGNQLMANLVLKSHIKLLSNCVLTVFGV